MASELHMAVSNNEYHKVERLLKEYPDDVKELVDGKSPVYIAAEKGYHEMVQLILSARRVSPSYDGPAGKTALHAAAHGNFAECIARLLKEMHPDAAKKGDAFGWTALHHAANSGHTEPVKLLLSKYKSLAHVPTAGQNGDSKTALHLAVIGGHSEVISEMLEAIPDCLELSTGKGRNALHLAVEKERKDVLKFLLGNPLACELINKKDEDGNTPLHLYAATKTLDGCDLLKHPCLDTNVSNRDYKTPLDMATSLAADEARARRDLIAGELRGVRANPGFKNFTRNYNKASFETDSVPRLGLVQDIVTKKPLRKVNDVINKSKEVDDLKIHVRKIRLVVSALIITVTFVAGLSVPGGFDDDAEGKLGMALLRKSKAFGAFLVTNSLALIFATTEVCQVIFLTDLLEKDYNYENDGSLLVFSMPLMEIAFSTGLYATLQETGLKIFTVVVGSVVAFSTLVVLFKSFFPVEEDEF